jgi:pimeloyl-ACP methyl ester carboxylesterase
MTIAGHRVSRLALYEPPASLVGPTLVPVLNRCRELVDAGRDADAVFHFLTVTADPSPELEAALRPVARLLRRRAEGMLADLECITGIDPDLGGWSAIDTPTLLLTGTESDQYGRQSTDLLQELLPQARTMLLPGQAHHPGDATLVADTLRDFFTPSR